MYIHTNIHIYLTHIYMVESCRLRQQTSVSLASTKWDTMCLHWHTRVNMCTLYIIHTHRGGAANRGEVKKKTYQWG